MSGQGYCEGALSYVGQGVAEILFWHENANFAIIPNLHVSLVGFLKFFFFRIGGIILEGWEAELVTTVVIGI